MTKEIRITIRHIADLFYIHPEQRDLFEQWLAEYTRQQREEAWAEGIYHVEPLIGLFTRRSMMADNPYRSKEKES